MKIIAFFFSFTLDAKEEYTSRYLDGNIGRLTWPSAANLRPNLSDASNYDTGPLSPSLTSRLLPLDVTAEKAAQLGYMPLRDDFERVGVFYFLISQHIIKASV